MIFFSQGMLLLGSNHFLMNSKSLVMFLGRSKYFNCLLYLASLPHIHWVKKLNISYFVDLHTLHSNKEAAFSTASPVNPTSDASCTKWSQDSNIVFASRNCKISQYRYRTFKLSSSAKWGNNVVSVSISAMWCCSSVMPCQKRKLPVNQWYTINYLHYQWFCHNNYVYCVLQDGPSLGSFMKTCKGYKSRGLLQYVHKTDQAF